MNNTTPIPKRLKEIRKKAGLSQKTLGIMAGIDEFSASARMNQYETGKYIPNFSTLSRIAKALNVPTAYFYTENNDLAEMIRQYSSLDKEDQQTILSTIKQIISS